VLVEAALAIAAPPPTSAPVTTSVAMAGLMCLILIDLLLMVGRIAFEGVLATARKDRSSPREEAGNRLREPTAEPGGEMKNGAGRSG
jgi:hypothetical protein